ncbi:MAG: Ig-like domain-containing protein, partial [Coprococcus sp.]
VLTIDSVASDMDITAHFAKKELKVTIGFEANDEELGKVTAVYGTDEKSEITSGDSLAAGGDVVFTATPAEGQMIEGWYSDPECTIKIEGTQLEQQTYSAYTLYDDLTVYVKFVEIPDYTIQTGIKGTGTANITAISDGENVDIVSGKIKVKRHKDVTITVEPKDIYNTVEYWVVNGEKVESTELTYEVTDITDDMTVYAYISPTLVVDVVFKDTDEIKKYDDIDIKVGYAGEDGDTSGFTSINAVNNSVRIGSGKDVSFEITPSDDYMIGAWTVNYIKGGNVVKTETGDDFGFTNRILLEDVTSSIEVYAELVDKVGYYVPAEGSYNSEGHMVEVTDQATGEDSENEDAEKNENEAAYIISDMNISPDNVSFVDDNGQPITNMVRRNGDASVVVSPADGWRIRSITAVGGVTEDAEEEALAEAGDSENVFTVEPVIAEDGMSTGAYKVSTGNVTKDIEFVVDVVRVYAVNIADTENGSIKITKEDGTEVHNGDLVDDGTLLKYTATPDQYYDFDSWTLDAEEQTETEFEKTVDSELTVGALFKARYAKVNIAAVENGQITVQTEQGKNIENGSLVQEGTTIVCKATPAAHCDLSRWDGDAKEKTGTTIKLLVTKEMNISAVFEFRYVKVTVKKPVNGKIVMKTTDGKTISSGSTIKEGTVIVCTAKASKGCKLKNWTGSITGSQTKKTFAANKDMTISAKFVAKIPSQNTAGINRNIHAKMSGGALSISWGKVDGAAGYDVYVKPCYKSPDYTTYVKTVKGKNNVSTTIRKMGNNSFDKYDVVKVRVRAYKYVNGKKKYIQSSTMFHIVTKNNEFTNIKSIKLSKKSYTLNVNQTVRLKPTLTKVTESKELIEDYHGPKLYYCSTNTNVATVDSKGRIKAKASGKCTIYVISISGVTKSVKVTVK